MARRTTAEALAIGFALAVATVILTLFLLFTHWYLAGVVPIAWIAYFALVKAKERKGAQLARLEQETTAHDFQNTAVVKKHTKLKSDARAQFMTTLVGLTREECEQVAFDGDEFDLRRRFSVSDFHSVTSFDYHYVRIADSELPHIVQYTQTRKASVPDLPDPDAPKQLWSWMTVLTLHGETEESAVHETIKIYRKYPLRADRTPIADKLNKLFLLGKNPSYHGSSRLYDGEFDAARAAKAALKPLVKRVRDVAEGIAALQRLVDDGKISRDEGEPQLEALASELADTEVRCKGLREGIAEAEAVMAGIIKSLASYSDYKDDLAKIEKIGLVVGKDAEIRAETTIQDASAPEQAENQNEP